MNQREGRSGDVVLTDISPAAGEASGATDLLWDRPELKDIFHLLNASSANGTLSQHNRTKPMADVSIPGMSTIFGEGSVSRRCVWCFLLVLCISVASIQVNLFSQHLTDFFRFAYSPKLLFKQIVGLVLVLVVWLLSRPFFIYKIHHFI